MSTKDSGRKKPDGTDAPTVDRAETLTHDLCIQHNAATYRVAIAAHGPTIDGVWRTEDGRVTEIGTDETPEPVLEAAREQVGAPRVETLLGES